MSARQTPFFFNPEDDVYFFSFRFNRIPHANIYASGTASRGRYEVYTRKKKTTENISNSHRLYYIPTSKFLRIYIFTLLFIYVYTRLRFIYICVKSPSQSRIHYIHRRNVSPQRFLGRSYIYIYKFYVIIIISITREEEKNYRPLR